jgi:hypothetical protein
VASTIFKENYSCGNIDNIFLSGDLLLLMRLSLGYMGYISGLYRSLQGYNTAILTVPAGYGTFVKWFQVIEITANSRSASNPVTVSAILAVVKIVWII